MISKNLGEIDESLPMEEKRTKFEEKERKVIVKDPEAEKNSQSHRPEEMRFMLRYNSAYLEIYVYNPDAFAMAQFAKGVPMKFGYTVMHGILVAAAKIGKLDWITDATHVNFSENSPEPVRCDVDQLGSGGITMCVTLCDYKTGDTVAKRMVSLPADFSCGLIEALQNEVHMEVAGIEEEDQVANSEYRIYSYDPKDVAKWCRICDL